MGISLTGDVKKHGCGHPESAPFISLIIRHYFASSQSPFSQQGGNLSALDAWLWDWTGKLGISYHVLSFQCVSLKMTLFLYWRAISFGLVSLLQMMVSFRIISGKCTISLAHETWKREIICKHYDMRYDIFGRNDFLFLYLYQFSVWLRAEQVRTEECQYSLTGTNGGLARNEFRMVLYHQVYICCRNWKLPLCVCWC